MKFFSTLLQGSFPLILCLMFSINLSAQQAHIARSAKKEQLAQAKKEKAKATTSSQGVQVEMIIKSQPNTKATPVKQALLDKYGNDESAIVAARKVIRGYENQGFRVVTQKDYDVLAKKAKTQNSTSSLEKVKVLEKILD